MTSLGTNYQQSSFVILKYCRIEDNIHVFVFRNNEKLNHSVHCRIIMFTKFCLIIEPYIAKRGLKAREDKI